MDIEPFIGSEALAAGTLRRHQLRSNYRAVFPNVYVPAGAPLTMRRRAKAAWLWSRRNGIIAGLTAATFHGARWVDDDEPIELVFSCGRPPRGLRCYAMALQPGESAVVDGLPVTTPERTGFDVGRRGRLQQAVARLDALARATGVKPNDIADLATRHRGARGLRQLEKALPLVDPGAQSPRETYLRLLLMDNGLPRPQTQIPVPGDDGYPFAYLDMGWRDLMVAVEYDGDQHRTDRWQYVKDIRRIEELERRGWIIVRVVAEDRPQDILRRVVAALAQRRATLQ